MRSDQSCERFKHIRLHIDVDIYCHNHHRSSASHGQRNSLIDVTNFQPEHQYQHCDRDSADYHVNYDAR